jgi:Ni,Fe-hydrogenase III large subunit
MQIQAAAGLPTLEVQGFLEELRARVAAGDRPVTLWGRPGDAPADVVLTCVLVTPGRAPGRGELRALRTVVDRARGYPSLTPDLPRFHAFERELWEQHGVEPRGHPWLKPIRFPRGGQDAYPFLRIDGKELHEVAVGPIHAGVIEPGAFRFTCLGETVHHLELHLGYQHRGVEALLLARPARLLAPLVESISGDSAVAWALAYSRAIEGLAGHHLRSELEPIRGVALELERIAMHLVGLAGLAADVAFLPGASTYGRLRTAVINASQRIGGSRFGRGWVRPGGARAGLDQALTRAIRATLEDVRRDKAGIDRLLFSARTVADRLRSTGVVDRRVAEQLGLVGLAARASGVPIDARTQLGEPGLDWLRIPLLVEEAGDCWARCRLRAREIEASLDWLLATLDALGGVVPHGVDRVGELAPETLCVSVVEGWRGEVVLALETDQAGRLRHARAQDPSLVNWHGLAMAVRGNAISDFPICNKSFDLSYCGSDL